jgi:hypothetical protein
MRTFVLSATLFGLGISAPALAELSPYVVSGSATVGDDGVHGPITELLGPPLPAHAGALVHVDAFHYKSAESRVYLTPRTVEPFVVVSTGRVGNLPGPLKASAQLTFSFVVTGPTPTVPVSIDVTGESSSNHPLETSSVSVFMPDVGVIACLPGPGCNPPSWEVFGEAGDPRIIGFGTNGYVPDLQTNKEYVITLAAATGSEEEEEGTSARVWVTFAPFNSDYNLAFSDGLVPPPPVPEPSEWLLLALGLGTLSIRCARPQHDNIGGLCSPTQFLQDWPSKHDDQESKAA